MKPYSLDLRRRIVDAYHNGEGSVRELAERFAVAPNTVQNYLNLERTAGTVAPCPHSGGVPSKIDDAGCQTVRELVEEKNDRTLAELTDELDERQHVHVSISTMSRTLTRMGITRKKGRYTPASRIGPTWSSSARTSAGRRRRRMPAG